MARIPTRAELINAGFDEALANEIIDTAIKRESAKEKIVMDFVRQLESFNDNIVSEAQRLAAALEMHADRIVSNTGNLERAVNMQQQMNAMMNGAQYQAALVQHLRGYNTMAAGIRSAYQQQFAEYSQIFSNAEFAKYPNEVLGRAQMRAAQLLSSSTMTTKFLQPMYDTIEKAIVSNAKVVDTIKQIRIIAGVIDPGARVDAGDVRRTNGAARGKMVQYAKQIAYDSMAVGDRSYTQAIAKEIEPEWYYYAGGELPTTREFCAKRMKQFWHILEIADWADEKWQGKTENTDEETIFVFLGGYNCQHTLIPVTKNRVPPNVIDRATKKGYYDPNAKTKPKVVVKPKPIEQPAPESAPEKPDDEKTKAEKTQPIASPEQLVQLEKAMPKEELERYANELDQYLKLGYSDQKIEFNGAKFEHLNDMIAELKTKYGQISAKDSMNAEKLWEKLDARIDAAQNAIVGVSSKIKDLESKATKDGAEQKMIEFATTSVKKMERELAYFQKLKSNLLGAQQWMTENLPIRMRPNMRIAYEHAGGGIGVANMNESTKRIPFQWFDKSESIYGGMKNEDAFNVDEALPINLNLNERVFLNPENATGKEFDGINVPDFYADEAGLTYIHEYAHFFDNMIAETSPVNITYKKANSISNKVTSTTAASFFASEQNHPLVKKLMDVIKRSPEYGQLKFIDKLVQKSTPETIASAAEIGLSEGIMGNQGIAFMHYLLTPRELFARAMAQYVATKMGNKDGTGMVNTFINGYTEYGEGIKIIGKYSQWSTENFKPIEKQFDIIFELLK